jgi:large subunit ribosomal protein L29
MAKKKAPQDLDDRELAQQLREIEEKQFRIRFQLSLGQADGVKRLREMRKDRARLLTIRRQREIQAAGKVEA